MNSKDFEHKLAFLTGFSASEIDLRMRALRRHGDVARGAGRHSPDLSPGHAALMILQLVARRATDALEAGLAARELRAVVPPTAPNGVRDALSDLSLLALLEGTLNGTGEATLQGATVAIDGTFATAVVEVGTERAEVYFTDLPRMQTDWVAAFPDRYADILGTALGHHFIIGTSTIRKLAQLVRGDQGAAEHHD